MDGMYVLLKKIEFKNAVIKAGIKWEKWDDEYDDDCDMFRVTLTLPHSENSRWSYWTNKAEDLCKELGKGASVDFFKPFLEIIFKIDFCPD